MKLVLVLGPVGGEGRGACLRPRERVADVGVTAQQDAQGSGCTGGGLWVSGTEWGSACCACPSPAPQPGVTLWHPETVLPVPPSGPVLGRPAPAACAL